MKVELIKKLRLKKGCKYILFFPHGSIDPQELAEMDHPALAGITFYLKTTRGLKVIEKEEK